MLVDIFCGTNILSEWAVVWLGLPILAHSGANPWIYAFHHGEMRIAAGKIAEDLVALIGVTPSRYGCSPTRRGTNTHLELAEVNNDSNESRQHPPVEDCFAAKHNVIYASRRCLEVSSRHAISPEKNDIDHAASCSSQPADIIEENIHDLTKMLDPKYIIDRNHVIDSNHNIDKIKNLKYLLDPTFNKIRHLRRLNYKRMNGKSFPLISEPKFISYQNLKSDGAHGSRRFLQLNALSDPMLSADNPVMDTKDFNETLRRNKIICQRRNSNLASMSDSNLKAVTAHVSSEAGLKLFPSSDEGNAETHGYSVQNLNHVYEAALARHAMMLCRQMEADQRRSSKVSTHPRPKLRGHFGRANPNLKSRLQSYSASTANNTRTPGSEANNPKPSDQPPGTPQVTITPNKLANLINLDPPPRGAHAHRVDLTARTVTQARRSLDIMRHSESINTIDPVTHCATLLEPSNLMDSLTVPTTHSEPPSPIDPLPSICLQEEETQSLEIPSCTDDVVTQRMKSPLSKRSAPVRHSDPMIPTVLLNIEDFSEPSESSIDQTDRGNDFPSNGTPTLEPIDLLEALLINTDKSGKDARLPEPIFAEHDSTRFSSRRPSDSKWSESSRSQEILSNVIEHQTFPSSYSVNDFQICNSGSDLNDLTSLDPFMCPDALTSSLRESFFSAPSVPGSDVFTSFEDSCDEPILTPDFTPNSGERDVSAYNSMSTMNLRRCVIEAALQSRSTDSVYRARYSSTRSCAILRLQPAVHCNKVRQVNKACANYILKDPPAARRDPRSAPLAIPTPTDICTPTFDVVSEIKSDNGVGVRV
jgi:hypothetical protein